MVPYRIRTRRRLEVLAFVMELTLLFVGTVGVILVGTHGLFDRTLLQMIIAGTLAAWVFVCFLWAILAEYLE